MRKALSTPTDKLQTMGHAGAQRVAKRHDIATEAVKLKNLFTAAINKNICLVNTNTS